MSNIPIEVFDINFVGNPAGPASQSRNEKDSPHNRPAPGVVARKRVRNAKHPPKIPPKTTAIPGTRPRKKSAAAPSAPTMAPMTRKEARDLMRLIFWAADGGRSFARYREGRIIRSSSLPARVLCVRVREACLDKACAKETRRK